MCRSQALNFQAEGGVGYFCLSRALGDEYNRQDSIEERLVRATESIEALELRWRSMKQERDTELVSSRESLDETNKSLASATAHFQSVQRAVPYTHLTLPTTYYV